MIILVVFFLILYIVQIIVNLGLVSLGSFDTKKQFYKGFIPMYLFVWPIIDGIKQLDYDYKIKDLE